MRRVAAYFYSHPEKVHFSAVFPGKAVLCAVLFSTFLLPAAGEERELALPLLAAPINATWAANHGEDWYEKGFRGFLFEGLLDDLRLFPTEQERVKRFRLLHADSSAGQEDNTAVIVSDADAAAPDVTGVVVPGHWNELMDEISGANNRLCAVGVDRNFLHVHLAPDEAWFCDPLLLEIAEQRFRLAGQLCRTAKLRGIALNTQSDSFIYDYRWDGYGSDLTPETLAEGTYQFGVRVFRAFIRAYPEGEIIVIAQDTETCGPLWFDLVEGIFDAPGAAEDLPVRLAVLEPPDIGNRSFFKNYPEHVARLLNARRSRNLRVPRRDTGVIFALEPVHYEKDIPTARYPLKDYRPALYAAALYGDTYMLLWAPKGGWWQIPPDMAEQYRHLKQGGVAGVRFAPPVPRTLDAYAPFLYRDMGGRVGSLEVLGQEVEVMKNGRGAALLFWEDTADVLHLSARTGIVTAVNLMAEERLYFTPKEDRVLIPPLYGPVLVEGIPLKEYALPASVGMTMNSPIVAGITQSPVEISIDNSLTVPLRGTLALLADSAYALGAASFPIDLPPGQSASYTRMLRGISSLGMRPEFAISLAITRESPITRKIVFPVAPEERFSFFCDGMAPGALVADPFPDGGQMPLLLSCDVRGRLTCYDTGACAVRWSRRVSGSCTSPPLLLKDSQGDVRAGISTMQGRLTLFNLAGEEKLLLMNRAKHGVAPVALTTEENTGDLLVMADDKDISLYDSRGALTHRIPAPGRAHYLLADPVQPGLFFLAASGGGDTPDAKAEEPDGGGHPRLLICFNDRGHKVWDASFAAGLSCSPVIIGNVAGVGPGVCIGDSEGGIVCLNARDGTVLESYPGKKRSGAVLKMAGVPSVPGGGAWVFYLANKAIHARPLAAASSGEKQREPWDMRVDRPSVLAPLPGGDGLVVGTADGSLYALDTSGALLWEDHNGLGAVTGITLFNSTIAQGSYMCAVCSVGHEVRGLHIRPELLPKVPLHLNSLNAP